MFGNEEAFQESLEAFTEYAKSDLYKLEEREYKENLVRILGEVMTDSAIASPDFLPRLREAFRKCSGAISNLTHYTYYDDCKNYLDAVPEERIRALFQGLFNEQSNLSTRIDDFKNEVDADYKRYWRADRQIRWLIAVFLAARDPVRYIFYRPTIIKAACQRWNIDITRHTTYGDKYVAYLDFLKPIQSRLTGGLGRPADLIDAHTFLWFDYTRRAANTNVWKIAPGKSAKFWEMCRDRDCIVIHWLDDIDFKTFPDKDAIKKALTDAGQRGGGAPYIWSFTNEIKPGNIVVANKGEKTVVGVGVIKSDYIPPKAADNPSTDSEFRHARLVEWRITKPVDVPFKFLQPTVESLQAEKWAEIKKAYFNQYPNDQGLRRIFDSLEGVEDKERNDTSGDKMIRQLVNMAARTRNIILYGPPGTGKTYWVRQFAQYFLREQLKAAPPPAQQRLRLLQGLTWYEAILLAMMLGGKDRFKVGELSSSELLLDYASMKSSQKPANSIWAQLQIHTGPDSKTVNYSNRNEPFLFDKTSNAEWFLTSAGKEYVESNLSDILAQLKNPTVSAPEIEDFSDFTTFHQSFAYEEFVEGLKPLADDAGQMRYEVVDGIFKRICHRAERDPANKYLLIIDEINRANIAKVLGELITLLEDDKRLGKETEMKVTLPYSGRQFGVPPNLYVLGTMNTADRSIALLDLALRRRFSFVELMPDPSLLGFIEGVSLSALLERLNERITALLDQDHQIGHSYFIDALDVNALRFAWYHRVVPLLQEYFYNDGERLRAVIGKDFVKEVPVSPRIQDALGDLYDSEAPKYDIVKLEADSFLIALRNLSEK